MFSRWEKSFLNFIHGDQRGIFAALTRAILLLFSWFYKLAITIHRALFRFGIKKSSRPEGPVIISIGNIVVGGTGKTPATILLAERFYPKTKIAFLSRGYRSLAEKEETPIVLSRGNGPLHSALYCGDEPCIISEHFPQSLSYVGKRRDIASRWAAEAGAEMILIDDGMQHHALQRDFDVVVMDVQDPFGQGHLLPRGKLREEPEGLNRAAIVILNHAHDPKRYQEVKQEVARYTSAPIVGGVYAIDALLGFDGRRIESIEHQKIALFCSIANPKNFERTIGQLKAQVIDTYAIPDHMLFDLPELQKYANRAIERGAQFMVCTEKDKVKLTGSLSASVPIAWLKIRMQITQDLPAWNSFLEEVEARLVRT